MPRSSTLGVVAFLFCATFPITSNSQARRPLPFLDGLTLIELETGDIPSLHRARDLIESSGGHIAIMSPPSLLIGWVPEDVRPGLLGREGILRIDDRAVDPSDLRHQAAGSVKMVNFFNAAVRGELKDDQADFEKTAPKDPATRRGDVREPPPFDEESYLENLRSVGLTRESLQRQGISIGETASVTAGNSDYMTGTVALSIFFMESDGTGADPDLFTWTVDDMQDYINGVATGLAWWANKATPYSGCSVSFLIYWYSANDPRVQQWVEPIIHDTSWEDTWVKNIMDNFGYTSGSRWSRVSAFNTWQRSTYLTDRAYSAFIPYNPYPGPGTFPNGDTAYAWYYGPYTVLPFRIDGTTTGQVFAHETGHIFGACDEYAGGCSHCGACANGIDNGNCEICNTRSKICMMRENEYALCGYTPGQLGWGVASPCTPTPPAPLPVPTITSTDQPQILQAVTGEITIYGTNFFAGAWVDFGGNVLTDLVTVVSSTEILAQITSRNNAPLGMYNVKVINRDFQLVSFLNAMEIIPTTRHYFSPTGGNSFPYTTPADAATSLDDAIEAAFDGDTLFIPTMTFSNMAMNLDTGVILHGGWDATFTNRDLVSGKTVMNLAGDITIAAGVVGAGFDGFIIESGAGAYALGPTPGYYGGALRVLSAGLVLANCEIRDNIAATFGNHGIGGAIYAESSMVDIRDCWFHDNEATLGAAMYLVGCYGSITGTTIEDNRAVTYGETGQGSGVYLVDCDNVAIDNCQFVGNTGSQDGGGLLVESSDNVTVSGGGFTNNVVAFAGGGLYAESSSLQISGVNFSSNSALIGAGAAFLDTSDVTVDGATFLWNTATICGGLYASFGSCAVRHSLFVGNSGSVSGGAIMLSSVGAGEVVGNTIDRNSSSGAAGIVLTDSPVNVFNNIVANSTGDGISCGGALPTLSYNDVLNSSGADFAGCVSGPGSGAWEPFFADTANGDYHLGAHSGAIDAGDPGAGNNDPDGSRGDIGFYGSRPFAMDQPSYTKNLTAGVSGGNVVLGWEGNPEGDVTQYAVYCDSISGFKPSADNFVGFVLAPDTSVNLGAAADTAFYLVCAIDSMGYAGGFSNEATISPLTSVGDPFVTVADRLYQNVPNPFNPATTIHFDVSRAGQVRLDIYDVAGRLVKRLAHGHRNSGSYDVLWDGTNRVGERVSSGVYFYKLSTSTYSRTRKMVLLK